MNIHQIIKMAFTNSSRINRKHIRALCLEIERLQKRVDYLQEQQELAKQASDPVPKICCCMWCGTVINGSRDAAKHIFQCGANPLVQQLRDVTKEK